MKGPLSRSVAPRALEMEPTKVAKAYLREDKSICELQDVAHLLFSVCSGCHDFKEFWKMLYAYENLKKAACKEICSDQPLLNIFVAPTQYPGVLVYKSGEALLLAVPMPEVVTAQSHNLVYETHASRL